MSFIDRLDVANVGCIKQVSLPLTRLHALIGPNDSGKTTLLRAFEFAQQNAAGRYISDPKFRFVDQKRPAAGPTALSLGCGRAEFRLGRLGDGWTERLTIDVPPATSVEPLWEGHSSKISRSTHDNWERSVYRASRDHGGFVAGRQYLLGDEAADMLTAGVMRRDGDSDNALAGFRDAIRRPRLLRFDPDALRAPSTLLRGDEDVFFRDERGSGLPALLDAIRDRGNDEFARITDRLREKFPTVDLLQLDRSSDGSQKSVAVQLSDGTKVTAEYMSEGMLYFLAFLAVERLESALFLIEEPENGLHPARVGEVMDILRSISERSQVLIATHNPLVVNELDASEVTVVRRTAAEGTLTRPLSQTADFERRSKVYAPGELWLNYADGIEETPLIDGGPRPQ